MQTKFERFSSRARRVFSLSQAAAQRLNHKHIEPEHLLLGLAQLNDVAAAMLLRGADADLDQIKMQVERLMGKGSEPTSDALALTPRTKRVIAVAIAEAGRMGDRLIGTQHLLLGLLQEGEGIAFEVLTEWGLTVDHARAQTPPSTVDEGDLRETMLKQPAFEGSTEREMILKQPAFKGLTEREREILIMRFGLKGGLGHTLEEVSRAFGITRERIREIEAKALRKLREGPEQDLSDLLR